MHILAGRSALEALRAARFRELAIPLPEPLEAVHDVRLPGRNPTRGNEPTTEPFVMGMPLERSGFDFFRVECNAGVDLWRLGELEAFTRDHPLELAVFNEGQKMYRKKSRSHLLSREIPADALIRVDPNLYFVGPELIVLQMAARLSVLELAQLIMELCGSYALEPVADAEGRRRCNYDAQPVTTIARIRRYSFRVRARGGTQKLHAALGMALEGAASPAETVLALAMSLPFDQGGYGFDRPWLNATLTVPDEDRAWVGGGTYKLDAFWQDAFADLEYESSAFHLDPLAAQSFVAARDEAPSSDPAVVAHRRELIAKADADRRRLRDLQLLGIQVIPVTGFDLRSVRRMDQVAYALARRYEQVAGWEIDTWLEALEEHANRMARQRLLQELQPEVTVVL